MLALQLIAIVMILLSAALMFGPQLVIMARVSLRLWRKMVRARLVGGGLTAALVMAVFGPQMVADPSAGGEVIRIVMTDGTGLSIGRSKLVPRGNA